MRLRLSFFLLLAFSLLLTAQNHNSQLIEAAHLNDLKEVKRLISLGANVNYMDANGFTPLTKAIRSSGNYRVVKYLLKNGSDMNIIGKDSLTPAAYAAMYCCYKNLLLLIENGANVNLGNSYSTPLLWAVQGNCHRSIQVLIKYGANVNFKDHVGQSILKWASEESGNADVVKLLLDNGAKVNEPNIDGATPLMSAAANKYASYKMVRYLVEGGADVNAQNNNGYTALMFAVLNGQLESVKYLVEHGANIRATNNEGKNAVDLADTNGNEDIELYLNQLE